MVMVMVMFFDWGLWAETLISKIRLSRIFEKIHICNRIPIHLKKYQPKTNSWFTFLIEQTKSYFRFIQKKNDNFDRGWLPPLLKQHKSEVWGKRKLWGAHEQKPPGSEEYWFLADCFSPRWRRESCDNSSNFRQVSSFWIRSWSGWSTRELCRYREIGRHPDIIWAQDGARCWEQFASRGERSLGEENMWEQNDT